MNTLDTVVNTDTAKNTYGDLKVVGDPDNFQLLFKASSKGGGFTKSTKAMAVPGGVVLQVSTYHQNSMGSMGVAEALVFVPGARIAEDVNGGKKLV